MIRSKLSNSLLRRIVASRTAAAFAAVTSILLGHSLATCHAEAGPPKKFTKPSFTPRTFQPKSVAPPSFATPRYQKPSTRSTFPNVKTPSPKAFSQPRTLTPPRSSFKPQIKLPKTTKPSPKFQFPQPIQPSPKFRPGPKLQTPSRPNFSYPGSIKLPGKMQTLPGQIKPGFSSPRIPSVPSPRPNFGGGSNNLRPKLPSNIKDLIKTPIPRPQPRIPDFGRPEASPPAGNNQQPLLPGGFAPRDPRLPGNFHPGANNGANNGGNANDNAGGQGNGERPRRPDLSDLMQPRPRIPGNIIDIIRPEDLRPQLPGNFGEGGENGNGNAGGNDAPENNEGGNDGQPDADVPPMELPPGAGNDAPDANVPDADVPPMELPPEADNPNENAPHDDHNHHGQFPPAVIIDLICGNHGAGYCPPGIGFPGVGQPNVIVDPGFIASPPVDHGPLVSPIDESDLRRLPRVENGDEITLLLEQPVALAAEVSLRAVLVIGDRPMVVEITSPAATAVPGDSAARTVSTIAVQLPTLLLIDEQPATILLGLSDTGEIVLEQPFVIVPLG